MPIIRSSGSSTANGWSPTRWRPHSTAWPRPSALRLAHEDAFHVVGLDRAHDREQLGLVRLLERVFELEGEVEVVFDGALVAAGDEDHLAHAGGVGLLDGVLHQRLVDDRQHLLRQRLGGGQEAGAEAGHRKDRVSDQHLLTIRESRSRFLHARATSSRRIGNAPMDLLVIDPIDADVMTLARRRGIALRFAPELAFAPREFRARALQRARGDRPGVGERSTPRRSTSRPCCAPSAGSAPAPRTSTSRPASGARSRSCAASRRARAPRPSS